MCHSCTNEARVRSVMQRVGLTLNCLSSSAKFLVLIFVSSLTHPFFPGCSRSCGSCKLVLWLDRWDMFYWIVWVRKEPENMHCNNVPGAEEQLKMPKSFCVCDSRLCVSGCVASLQNESQWDRGKRRIKGIRGEDWKRLIKAHATSSLMNSLTPSAEVNSCFPKSPSCSVCRWYPPWYRIYQCPGSHRLHLAKTQSGNLGPGALWLLL